MEYTVNSLAKISGVSTRTLRYYDEIGLLKPACVRSNGYRIYGKREVDELQEILFYRELGFSLDEIKAMLSAPDYDREKSLEGHLAALTQKKSRIEALINNVSRTIISIKGDKTMSDKEKFEGFKQSMVDENTRKYGKEVIEKYGEDAFNSSNAKFMNMSREDYEYVEQLSKKINETLLAAMRTGDPSGELAKKTCELHREWLCKFWADGAYSKEAHKGLGEMYVADERFKAYYDKIANGAAEFLRDALNIFCA